MLERKVGRRFETAQMNLAVRSSPAKLLKLHVADSDECCPSLPGVRSLQVCIENIKLSGADLKSEKCQGARTRNPWCL